MHPDLFQLPFLNLTVRTYGVMIVIGFLLAVYVIRRLSRNITPDPDLITSAALYSLIAGVVGARITMAQVEVLKNIRPELAQLSHLEADLHRKSFVLRPTKPKVFTTAGTRTASRSPTSGRL